MSEIARKHHKNLQKADLPRDKNRHRSHTKKVLSHMRKHATKDQKNDLKSELTRDKTLAAMQFLKSGKAAGLDGIIHELWMALADRFEERQKEEEQGFDIAEALTIVFNDIYKYGMEDNTSFAKGWLCLLYKKGDKTEIGNYRPIMVLNMDYKIFTKALTMRLSKVALSLIHRDQAGFMPGCRIEDQTELAQIVIKWCHRMETNICLDQEKAYDRILHLFL